MLPGAVDQRTKLDLGQSGAQAQGAAPLRAIVAWRVIRALGGDAFLQHPAIVESEAVFLGQVVDIAGGNICVNLRTAPLSMRVSHVVSSQTPSTNPANKKHRGTRPRVMPASQSSLQRVMQ